MTFAIDNAAGTLTTITCSVNQASLQGILNLLEDTALCDTANSYVPDLAGATISLNGWINSTTDGIFGPLVGARTSLTKTVEFYNAQSYYNGEVYPSDVTFSGAAKSLQTFSANLTFDGAVTRTSVTLVA